MYHATLSVDDDDDDDDDDNNNNNNNNNTKKDNLSCDTSDLNSVGAR